MRTTLRIPITYGVYAHGAHQKFTTSLEVDAEDWVDMLDEDKTEMIREHLNESGRLYFDWEEPLCPTSTGE